MASDRNLTWYFLRSNVWIKYEHEHTLNRIHLLETDPERYSTILFKSNFNVKLGPLKKGVKIWDYIYDMFDCVEVSNLAPGTKKRLRIEISDLLLYHEEKDTSELII